VKHFKDFLNDRDIAFSDITVSLFERFKIFLKTTYRTIILLIKNCPGKSYSRCLTKRNMMKR
jgi:hypothetical protein